MNLKGEPLTPLRQARHNMRGGMNGLKLCISALPTCDTPAELLEFLDHIEEATEKVVRALDEYERLLDQEG
jgi:hypothetical protein